MTNEPPKKPKPQKSQPAPNTQRKQQALEERNIRRAKALRNNLRRRKEQAAGDQ